MRGLSYDLMLAGDLNGVVNYHGSVNHRSSSYWVYDDIELKCVLSIASRCSERMSLALLLRTLLFCDILISGHPHPCRHYFFVQIIINYLSTQLKDDRRVIDKICTAISRFWNSWNPAVKFYCLCILWHFFYFYFIIAMWEQRLLTKWHLFSCFVMWVSSEKLITLFFGSPVNKNLTIIKPNTDRECTVSYTHWRMNANNFIGRESKLLDRNGSF